jgi:AcrR family transcriptional regulator
VSIDTHPATRSVRRRSDGEQTHEAILEAASELATVEGLNGLTIGRLADHVGISKSGLYAHFGSKEELQMATIDAAQAVFEREVTDRALERDPGLAQLRALSDEFLGHLERRVFPGGCFFAAAAAEFDAQDGRVRERVRGFMTEWMEMLTGTIVEAQARGELDAELDPDQLAFEVESLLLGANAAWVMNGDPVVLERARRAVDARLAA